MLRFVAFTLVACAVIVSCAAFTETDRPTNATTPNDPEASAVDGSLDERVTSSSGSSSSSSSSSSGGNDAGKDATSLTCPAKTLLDGFERMSLTDLNMWDSLPLQVTGINIDLDSTIVEDTKSLKVLVGPRAGGGALASFLEEGINTNNCDVTLSFDLNIASIPTAPEAITFLSFELAGKTISSTAYVELNANYITVYERTSAGAFSPLYTNAIPAVGTWSLITIAILRPSPEAGLAATTLSANIAGQLTSVPTMADGNVTVKNLRLGVVTSSLNASGEFRIDRLSLH